MRQRAAILLNSLLEHQGFLILNAISIGGTVAGMGIAYLFHFFSARILSLADYGTLGVFVGIWTVLITPVGSITSVLSREMANYESTPGKLNSILRKYAIKFGLFATVISILGISLAIYFNQPLLAILFFGFPAAVLTSVVSSWLQAREHILALTLVQNGFHLVKLIILLILFAAGFGLLGAVASLPASYIILFLLLFFWLSPKIKTTDSVKIHLKNVFIFLAVLQLIYSLLLYEDLFFVKTFLAPEQAGIYNAAEITAKILTMLAGAIGLVLYPKLAKLDSKKLASDGLKLMAMGMALLVPVFIGFQLLAYPFITLFYGEKFIAAVEPFRILSVAFLAMGWVQILYIFLLARHREGMLLLSFVIAVPLNGILLWFAVPTFGLLGAAASTTITALLLLATLSFCVWRHLKDSGN